MKNISLKRVKQLFIRELIFNWKGHMRNIGIIYVSLTCYLCFAFYNYFAMGRFVRHDLASENFSMMATICMIICFFYQVCLLSLSFSDLKTKQQRINVLMLPTTNLEKFATSIISAFIKGILFCSVAFILADLTRMAIMPIFGIVKGTLIPDFFNESIVSTLREITDGLSSYSTQHINGSVFTVWNGYEVIMEWSAALLLFTYYILMSVLFRKRALLWGSVILILGFALFAFTVIHLAKAGIITNSRPVDSMQLRYILSIVVMLALSVAGLWFSFHRYCRLQVIPQKLFNK